MERTLDAILPGSGLVISGRLAGGLPLLVCALAILATAILATLVGGSLPGALLPLAAPGYLGLVAVAQAARWAYDRRTRFDPQAVRTLARETERAWMRDEAEAARAGARRLLKLAPEDAGAWRLWALVSGDARARLQAERLEREQAAR